MQIPMTDLTVQYASLNREILPAVQKVLESGRFILGQEVEEFEKELAAYCGTRYAIGVASGTDALILSLAACSFKPGDEVITTPFTFIATAEAISHCGATPVFVDIEPRTFNVNPYLIESKITPRTRAIIPVHLFGQAADMDFILDIARKYNLLVIEDCAQALSAEYKNKKLGSLGDAGCLSFFPSKNLGAYGDGGMVVTNDFRIAERVRMLRNHGAKTTYYHSLLGFNSRLDALQAAILRIKLRYLDRWSALRREKSKLYTTCLLNEIEGIEPPYVPEFNLSSANYYTVRIRNQNINRGELRKYLASKSIETAIYYPLSLHLQEAYQSLGYQRGDFPESELAQEQVLSLPLYPELSEESINFVIKCIREFVHSSPAV